MDQDIEKAVQAVLEGKNIPDVLGVHAKSSGEFASEGRELSVPDRHQKKIALDTLRLSDAGASIMGGMSKEEARTFLKKIGYSDERIKKIEGTPAGESVKVIDASLIRRVTVRVDFTDANENVLASEKIKEKATKVDEGWYQLPVKSSETGVLWVGGFDVYDNSLAFGCDVESPRKAEALVKELFESLGIK